MWYLKYIQRVLQISLKKKKFKLLDFVIKIQIESERMTFFLGTLIQTFQHILKENKLFDIYYCYMNLCHCK